MDITAICFVSAIIVSLITGIVQMLKTSFNIPARKIPFVSCLVGFLVGLAAQPFSDYSYYTMSVAGFVFGLASCGLFDLSKFNKNK